MALTPRKRPFALHSREKHSSLQIMLVDAPKKSPKSRLSKWVHFVPSDFGGRKPEEVAEGERRSSIVSAASAPAGASKPLQKKTARDRTKVFNAMGNG